MEENPHANIYTDFLEAEFKKTLLKQIILKIMVTG